MVNKKMKNSIRRSIYFPLILLIAVIMNGCRKNPTAPEAPPKSPDKYVWAADTLAITEDEFQMTMESVWGTSPNNIYVCGHAASHLNNFWHYDGSRWTVIKQPVNITGALNLQVVTGSSADNIWIAGGRLNPYETSGRATSSPFIAHIEGQGNWKEYPLPLYKNVWIGNLYLESPKSIWALGQGTEPVLFHFDGTRWNFDSLKVPFSRNVEADILLFSMATFKDSLYLIASKYENSSALRTFYLFEHIDNRWKCIDSSKVDLYKYQEPRFGEKLLVTGDNKLISYGVWGIYEFDGKDWQKINSTGCWKIVNSYGKNLLAATNDGRICLFEGSVLQPIEGFTNPLQLAYRDIWTDGREAFITGYIVKGWPMRSIVWHGK